MVGSGQVQTCSASLDGEDREAWSLAVGRLRPSDHPVARGLGNLPLNQEYLAAHCFFKVAATNFAHFGELSDSRARRVISRSASTWVSFRIWNMQRFVEVVERLHIPYLVTGSMATIAYGEPRFTNDIDVVVALPLDQVDLFCAFFPAPEF